MEGVWGMGKKNSDLVASKFNKTEFNYKENFTSLYICTVYHLLSTCNVGQISHYSQQVYFQSISLLGTR
jgi:hypothetical protein